MCEWRDLPPATNVPLARHSAIVILHPRCAVVAVVAANAAVAVAVAAAVVDVVGIPLILVPSYAHGSSGLMTRSVQGVVAAFATALLITAAVAAGVEVSLPPARVLLVKILGLGV